MTTKKQLISLLAVKNTQLSIKQSKAIIDVIINFLTASLVSKKRIEIRGFGAFTVRKRAALLVRNPKTNQLIPSDETNKIYYRPSKNIF
jgi:integration host factor subunit beta